MTFRVKDQRKGGKTTVARMGRRHMARIGRKGRMSQLADLAKKIKRCPKCKQIIHGA